MTMSADELARAATDHLWLHFSRLAGEGGDAPPIIKQSPVQAKPNAEEPPPPADKPSEGTKRKGKKGDG